MPAKVRAVFLDAGYTLLFPRLEGLIRELEEMGFRASEEDFEEAERAAKRKLDELLWPRIRAGEAPRTSGHLYWESYFEVLMDRLGASREARPALIEKVAGTFRDIRTWSKVMPETLSALESLRAARYFLAAISNSNGTVESELRRAGFGGCLRFVIDSALEGVEKPHPEIFRRALRRANIAPEEAVYVGDVYSVDVGGAQTAGLRGILYDRVGAYPDAGCLRIRSVMDLINLLRWSGT
jgi:HAD superfamily hydrolase (TIGR01509 family)